MDIVVASDRDEIEAIELRMDRRSAAPDEPSVISNDPVLLWLNAAQTRSREKRAWMAGLGDNTGDVSWTWARPSFVRLVGGGRALNEPEWLDAKRAD